MFCYKTCNTVRNKRAGILAQADYYTFFFVIENGRKSDFRPTKQITSSFDVPPYRDFVTLVIFHGGISRKIRPELGTPRYEEECSTPCWAIKRNAAPLGELRKASRSSSKELSLSQGAFALLEHELLATVEVKSAKKHV